MYYLKPYILGEVADVKFSLSDAWDIFEQLGILDRGEIGEKAVVNKMNAKKAKTGQKGWDLTKRNKLFEVKTLTIGTVMNNGYPRRRCNAIVTHKIGTLLVMAECNKSGNVTYIRIPYSAYKGMRGLTFDFDGSGKMKTTSRWYPFQVGSFEELCGSL
jgi:hypothetical protein